MTTMTLSLDYGKGYTGKLGNKCWAAEITGADNTYGLKRAFLEPTKVEREHFNRPRTIIHFAFELEADGLYEISESGERSIIGVLPQKDGSLKCFRLSDARVKAWIAALDEGKSNREARLASRGL